MKLAEEKRKLFEAINHYNDQVPGEEKVENRLGAVGGACGTDSLIWPLEAAVSYCKSASLKQTYNMLTMLMFTNATKIIF